MGEKNENTVQSLDRAIEILEMLTHEKNGFGITALAQKTALHKSTVHRLLKTLMHHGYVERDPESDNYRLGMKILYLASAILDRMDIRLLAKPFLEKLSYETREVVHLAILDEGETVYIDKVESSDSSIRMYSQIGKRGPVHCTGVGKVMLSGLSEGEVDRIIREKGMKAFTPYTITDINELKVHLDKIAIEGYAIDEREHEEGIRCVAAPIFDRNNKIIAAISVSGPVFRVTEDRLSQLIEKIVKTSKEISYQLGYIK